MASTIRRAVSGDKDAIMPLWKELADFHAALGPAYALDSDAGEMFRVRLEQTLADDDWRIFLAEDDGQPIGFLSALIRENPPAYRERSYGYVEDAVVAESSRRRGVGAALYRAATAWFRERGVKTVQLSAASANPVSLAFWRKQGFRDHMIRMRGELK